MESVRRPPGGLIAIRSLEVTKADDEALQQYELAKRSGGVREFFSQNSFEELLSRKKAGNLCRIILIPSS